MNKLKPNDRVFVDAMNDETALIFDREVAGGMRKVSEFDPHGTVVKLQEHPPHVDRENIPEDPNPSPHVLVRLKAPDGSDHDVWFHASRVQKS